MVLQYENCGNEHIPFFAQRRQGAKNKNADPEYWRSALSVFRLQVYGFTGLRVYGGIFLPLISLSLGC